MRGAVVPLELHRTCFETTSKTPNYCLILQKLFTFGIAQASLTPPKLCVPDEKKQTNSEKKKLNKNASAAYFFYLT